MVTLGEKLKYFRKRAGLSQMAVETSVDMAAGQLSRIENGEVNPTKETLDKIFATYNLESREISWTNGLYAHPVSEKEIEEARNEVSKYFEKKGVMAYLLDERFRLFSASDGFIKALKFSEEMLERIWGVSIIELMIDASYGIKQYLDSDSYEDALYHQLSRYYHEVYFMDGDEFRDRTYRIILQDEIAGKIFNGIVRGTDLKYHHKESREVAFKIGGLKIKMHYARENLEKHSRFEVIEYIPNNLILRILR